MASSFTIHVHCRRAYLNCNLERLILLEGVPDLGLPASLQATYQNDNDNENIVFNIDIMQCSDVIQITIVYDVIHNTVI